MPIPNSNTSFYITAIPFGITFSDERKLALAFKFITNPETDELAGIRGFELFAKGFDTCFNNDTLNILLENGKKLILPSSNPLLCNQILSGWFLVSKEKLDTLFSSRITQITYKNGVLNESFTQDITGTDAREYFQTVKKIYDTKVPPPVPPKK